MPQRKTVEALVSRVEKGEFLQAIEAFYHPDATMQENGAAPRAGMAALLANERNVLKAFPNTRGELLSPAVIDGDSVALHWRFTFGPGRSMDEVALQRWNGDKIAEERFFYDPKQLG
jgi:hypothetical protein